jgi:hypothetical protein
MCVYSDGILQSCSQSWRSWLKNSLTWLHICYITSLNIKLLLVSLLHMLSQALYYKLEGRRFKSRMMMIFFNLPNPSSRTMALGLTQPLTKMSTRNFPGGKKGPAHRVDNLATTYEPNVWKMWEPQPLATIRASTTCTGKTLPFYLCYLNTLTTTTGNLLLALMHLCCQI